MMAKGFIYRQLKLTLLALGLGLVIAFLFASSALAGGWHVVGDTDSPDSGQWLKSNSPHLVQTSTNQCRTCHAVHNADNVSASGGLQPDPDPAGANFKLLRNKTRITECNACHDATSGLSTKRPYQVGDALDQSGTRIKVRGEHSLGSTIIPDSDTSIIFNGVGKYGLMCGNCHSVHGGATLEDNPAQSKYADPVWARKMLRKDPAGNGGDASISTAYSSGDIAGGFTVTSANSNAANLYAASKTAFCADCHNRNSNWDGDSDDTRPNYQSHVQGSNVDGQIVVNGISTQVANFGTFSNTETTNAGRSGWRLEQNTIRGCISCHQATTGGAQFPYDSVNTPSSFPHQSESSKFLQENFTEGDAGWVNELDSKGIRQSNRGINKANRSLNALDKVCLDCHRNERALGTDTLGVGKNF